MDLLVKFNVLFCYFFAEEKPNMHSGSGFAEHHMTLKSLDKDKKKLGVLS